jgi:hypothetical protein
LNKQKLLKMTKQKLPLSKNQRAFVLHMLLNKKEVSEQDVRVNGFRARISELNSLINIPYKKCPFVTALGKKSLYRAHYLKKEQELDAIEIYNKINK